MIKYKHYTRQANVYPKIDVISSGCLGFGFFWNFGTSTPHGFSIGDKVRFTGFTEGFNGIHEVTGVNNPSSFQVDMPCSTPPPSLGFAQQYSDDSFTELFPLGFRTISWEREDDEIFFRRKMNDELTFINKPNENNSNFNYFKSIEDGTLYYLQRCEEQIYYIKRSCDNGETYEAFWFGYFGINDGKFDLDKCIYKTKIKVDDEYRCLVENGDKDVNILEATPAVSVPTDYSPTFEFLDCTPPTNVGPTAQATFNGCIYPDLQDDGCSPSGFPCGTPIFSDSDCVTGGMGWQNYTTTYLHLGGGVFEVNTIWVRETNTTSDVGGNPNPPMGSGWVNIGSTTIGGKPATNWARVPYNGLYTTYNWSVNLGTCVFTAQLDLPLTDIVTYDTTGRLMEDVVNFVTSESCEEITDMVSDFFEINPPGDTPGYIPGDNYVTGTTNRINLLVFIQKSDFLNPTATTHAVKGILTFNQLMKVFKEVFQAYWFIEEGQLRIEHISWFTQTQAFNLTSANYLKFVNGKNSYEYIKAKMPREENWKWTEAGNIDFLGLPIIYNSGCVNQDEVRNTTIQNVVTDIQYISTHATGSTNEGFVLVATEQDGSDYAVLSEVGLISGLSLPNNHLSLANLLYNYFRHNRVLLDGVMNNNATNFFTAIKTKKQIPLSFPFCCDDELIPEQAFITTELGDGYIEDSVTLDVKTNMITMELVYDQQ